MFLDRECHVTNSVSRVKPCLSLDIKDCFSGQTLTIERLQTFGRETLFVT